MGPQSWAVRWLDVCELEGHVPQDVSFLGSDVRRLGYLAAYFAAYGSHEMHGAGQACTYGISICLLTEK